MKKFYGKIRAVFLVISVILSVFATGFSASFALAEESTATPTPTSLPAVPKSLDQALLLTIESREPETLGFGLDSHFNGSPSLLVDTNTFTTPNYNWGVALAYPDFCSYDARPYWLANIVYVVRGKIIEVERIPFGGGSQIQSVTHTFPSVIVRVDAVFNEDCHKSKITAKIIKR